MRPIAIVTDSTGDLSLEEIQALNIGFLPDLITFTDGTFRELTEMTVETFYSRMGQMSQLPKTAQPSLGEMKILFDDLITKGYDVIVYFISKKLSGTAASAELLAATYPPGAVTVFDTQSACLGLGCMVRAAARAAAAGADKSTIMALSAYIRDHFKLYFVVDNLEHLQKGGRIGKASGYLGSLLNICPILEIREGEVQPVEKVRGKQKAIDRMLKRVVESAKVAGPGETQYYLGYTGSQKELDKYREKILEGIGRKPEEVPLIPIGAAVGTHVGAGAVCLSCLTYPESYAAWIKG